MDWSAAIETNREALRRILTTLVTMAGLRGRFAPEAQRCPADATTKGEEGRAPAWRMGIKYDDGVEEETGWPDPDIRLVN